RQSHAARRVRLRHAPRHEPVPHGFRVHVVRRCAVQERQSETLTPLMAISNRRYIDYNPKDFFYAMLRDPQPPMITSCGAPVLLTIDEGVQPMPKWLPAIWHAQVNAKGESVGLTMFEANRVRWTLRAGSDEKAKGVAAELSGEDAKRAIAAIGFGA